MLGDSVTADQAMAIGLATRVVDDRELATASTELARRLADGPRQAYASTKMLVSRELDIGLTASLELDALTQALLMATADHAEFYAAFRDGRQPKWSGR